MPEMGIETINTIAFCTYRVDYGVFLSVKRARGVCLSVGHARGENLGVKHARNADSDKNVIA